MIFWLRVSTYLSVSSSIFCSISLRVIGVALSCPQDALQRMIVNREAFAGQRSMFPRK
jgi:hypothetical protein